MVRNLTPRGGPGKLLSYWGNEVHIVTAKKGDNPVYEVVPEGTKRKPRVLHRNSLLPCPYLPLDIPAQAPPPKSTKNTVKTLRKEPPFFGVRLAKVLKLQFLTGYFAQILGRGRGLCDQIMVRNHFW